MKNAKRMWFNNTRVKEVKMRLIEVFKILNGYENIDRNIVYLTQEI